MKINISNKVYRKNLNAKKDFGRRLKAYRKAANLDQATYAIFKKTSPAYISGLEQGNLDVRIETMEHHAKSFGVHHYQLSNPDFPIPALEQMPAAIRRVAAQAANERKKKANEKATKKAAGTGIYKTGMSKALHALVARGFFTKPRTTKDAYLQLHPGVRAGKLTADQQQAISKMTGTLSKGRFAKLLDKLEPLAGSTAVRFVQKASIQGYEGPGNVNVAAEKKY